MRKFNTFFAIIFLTIGLYILANNLFAYKPDVELKVYSLKSNSYTLYNENNNYNITYYANQMLGDKEYYIGVDSNRVLLTDVSETVEKTLYNNEVIYIITIHFNLTDEIEYKDAKLYIENVLYNISLDIGDIVVKKDDSKEVKYSYINGHYAYVDNNLRMVGITITLEEDYDIYNIKINNDSYIRLDKIIEVSKEYPNILTDYNENLFESSKGEKKLEKGKKYFLPLGYSSNVLLSRVRLIINDGDTLYLPPLHITNPNICNYPSFIRGGNIVRNS